MSRVTPILGLSLVLMAAACTPEGGTPPPGAECSINSTAEKGPGYPFDLAVYETQLLPTMTGCTGGACHDDGNATSFTVFSPNAKGDCGFAQTFNSLSANIDLNNPSQSKVVLALTTGGTTHPVKLDAAAALYLDYATKASEKLGNVQPPAQQNPLDYEVFKTQIQPILDAAGNATCTSAGCHGGGAGNFTLKANAVADADLEANLTAVSQRISLLQEPNTTTFYLKATNLHGFGGSRVVNATEASTILAWITDAVNNQNPVPTGCADPALFNVDVFRDDIQPVLFGLLDGQQSCAAAACHGSGGGTKLIIKESNTPEQNLASFACFVNLENPVASEIVRCPQNLAPCRVGAGNHPGEEIWEDINDPNYQRILSFLYATKTTTAPLDFAFFARNINSIFNDVNAVQGGTANITCANNACHGIPVAGAPPPNFSNFGIISSASDKATLQANFGQALNFTNFITPEGSSLFLYPTDEIANLENPFATGLNHPGGKDFEVDSIQALAILKWAKGLRPNNQGFVLDWLVAGDYNASLITTQTIIDEVNITPRIFDPSGAAQFNGGVWEGLFSLDNDEVDLNLSFPRAATAGRVAYAVAYVLNTTGQDIDAQLLVKSENAVKVYVDDRPVAQADNAGPVSTTALARFPAFANEKKSTRILIKVFQRAADDEFNFSVQLSDQFGNLLTDNTGELVVLLNPDGGI